MSDTEISFELTASREIVIEDRGSKYHLICRRIEPEDWVRYFNAIVVTSEQDGRERINVIDVNTPRLLLAESVLISAVGYRVANDVALNDLPDWQKRIPLAHRLRLGEALADVRPADEAGGICLVAEGEQVTLEATYTANTTGHMVKLQGLVHSLRSPTENQFRRYTRESSRSRVIGGSRSSKTVYQGAQLLLAQLYDELVIGVSGYMLRGQPLTSREQVICEMDMLHKVMAAQEIFQPQDVSRLASESDEG